MDTTGRTTLELTAANLVDDFRDRDLIVSRWMIAPRSNIANSKRR